MPTLDDVINFILTTENIEDIPTIMDALTERFATEMGLVADQRANEAEAMPEELPAEPMPEEMPAEAQAPQQGGLDLSSLML